jgi:hypothetical protein
MSFEEAMKVASRDERFMATIYAMNTLLLNKGVYSRKEFQELFTEWIGKEERKKVRSKADSHTPAQTVTCEP